MKTTTKVNKVQEAWDRSGGGLQLPPAISRGYPISPLSAAQQRTHDATLRLPSSGWAVLWCGRLLSQGAGLGLRTTKTCHPNPHQQQMNVETCLARSPSAPGCAKPDTGWFLCVPCSPKSLITEASDPLPPESANLLICSRAAQRRAAPRPPSHGNRPGILLPFSLSHMAGGGAAL